MKRNLLILFLLLTFHLSMNSQIVLKGELAKGLANIPELDYLDNGIIETIFEYIITDGVLNRTEIRTDILQLGSNQSKYFKYATYQMDSVVYKLDIYNMSRQEFTNIFNKYQNWKMNLSCFNHKLILIFYIILLKQSFLLLNWI